MIFAPLLVSITGLIVVLVNNYLFRWNFYNNDDGFDENGSDEKKYSLLKFESSGGLEDHVKFRYENLRTKINAFFLFRYHFKKENHLKI